MGRRILIVEDDPEFRYLYGFILAGESFEVELAHDGGGALESLGRQQPDLILLDLLLGDMSGGQFFRAVKQDPRYTSIPVIIATVLPSDACRDLLALSPSTAYLRKPFSKGDLVAAVTRAFASAQPRRADPPAMGGGSPGLGTDSDRLVQRRTV